MTFRALPDGQLAESFGCQFFFGNRNSSIENLQSDFPQLKFVRLKQFHSDIVVESSFKNAGNIWLEGDAHISHQKGIALCINTADCIPILIHDKKSNRTAAIHAGWRGVAQNILPKTLQRLLDQNCRVEDMQIVTGPHIQFESFEVGNDVRDQILASIANPAGRHFVATGDGKSKVHLLNVLFSQLESFNIAKESIHTLIENTFTNKDYHSFRRDKAGAGRQISFVGLLPAN